MPILRSGIRLIEGALRPQLRIDPRTTPSDWVARGHRVLSIDIFDTLLQRLSGDRLGPRRATAAQAYRFTARRSGNLGPDDTLARWASIERRLQDEHRKRNADPEVPHGEVLRDLLTELSGSPAADADVATLARFELDREAGTTTVAGAMAALVQRARTAGMRVIAVSDSWYSAQELQELLAHHHVEGVERAYSSSDLGASKFTGRLFTRVFEEERIRPGELLHVGDNRLADDYSARAAGAGALRVPRSRPSTPRAPEPSADPAFQLGSAVLGPALAFFTHVALLRAERDGVEDLAFVARDGDLLLEVARILQPAVPVLHRPALRYVYLSRRSTALAGRGCLDASAIAAALEIPASRASVEGVFASLGLEASDFPAELGRAGLDASTTGIGTYAKDERVRRLVDDSGFQRAIGAAAARQREALESYLRQEGFFSRRRVGLVDVGWRGSSQDSLSEAFGHDPEFATLKGYYMGLWADPVVEAPKGLGAKEGLISDFRRSRSTREGATWYLALLLESVCRASHGPVVGYAIEDGGRIGPVLLETGLGRTAEREGSDVQKRIREGVRAAAERYADCEARFALDEPYARRRTQGALHRLAFFPTAAELGLAAKLSHTETAIHSWSAPLVDESVNPLRSPRRWLAGLRSPWRAGYIAATGGWPLSLMFIAGENLLMRLPPPMIRALRQRALRLARAIP